MVFPLDTSPCSKRFIGLVFSKSCRISQVARFWLLVKVKGKDACDLYKTLTALDTEPVGPGKISWNFEKFIIGRHGEVVARFSPRTKPNDPEVLKAIEVELAKEV